MGKNRYSIIDVGTNNVLMVWAEITATEIKTIKRESNISAMGKNMKDGILTLAGIDRVKKILRRFIASSLDFTGNIIVTGTSCSRESKNVNLLSEWLEKRYGIKYRILSESEEASYLGLANRQHFEEYANKIFFDLGGGSCEFVYYQGDKIVYIASLKLGIRRMINAYQNDYRKMRAETKNILQKLPVDLLKDAVLIGIGGTVTNISAVKMKLTEYDSEAVHKSVLLRDDILNYIKVFKQLNIAEISELMPFEPMRADVILAGLNLIIEIVDYFSADTILVSDIGIQYGVLEELRGK